MSSEDDLFPSTFEGIVRLVERLRGPDGCPWDREQTHQSLSRLFIEECYELVEAIEEGDTDQMVEELGDVLFHLVLQAQIFKEAGEFSPERVYGALRDKLIRRHPHVFGDEEVRDADEQAVRWDALKREERAHTGSSTLDGVPKQMPALYYAQAIQERAARVGFDWDDVEGVMAKVAEELAELEEGELSAGPRAGAGRPAVLPGEPGPVARRRRRGVAARRQRSLLRAVRPHGADEQ